MEVCLVTLPSYNVNANLRYVLDRAFGAMGDPRGRGASMYSKDKSNISNICYASAPELLSDAENYNKFMDNP